MAFAFGLTTEHLARMIDDGVLVHPLRGCFYSAHLEDSLELRCACVRLLVPASCVVTDRTAGWLHGAPMILAPGDHLEVPKVSVFHRNPGNRLRNSIMSSGERSLAVRDVTEVQGIQVTTPLRTACDLGRLLHQDAAIAALDSMLRVGTFSRDRLLEEAVRFRGFRGIRQLRALAPLADGGAESYGESVLRLRWYQGGAPGVPQTQIEVRDDRGSFVARVDLGVEEWRYAAEYDGALFHGPEHQAHDKRRRDRLRALGWMVDVFRWEDVFSPRRTADVQLRQSANTAKIRFHAGSTT